jgi:hypothetical protein
MEDFFDTIRLACSKELWSQAVEMVRRDCVTTDKRSAEEIVLRVMNPETSISPKVTLWPLDEDWQCECKSKDDPCKHVAAAVIALRQAGKRGEELPRSRSNAGHISYRFSRNAEGQLLFTRFLVDGDDEVELLGTLSSITTLRVRNNPIGVSPTPLDMEIEHVLGSARRGILPQNIVARLFKLLKQSDKVTLDGAPVTVDDKPTGVQIVLEDEGPTVKLSARKDPGIQETWHDAIARCDQTLCPLRKITMDHDRLALLRQGQVFGRNQLASLVAEVLPRFKDQFEIINLSRQLPSLVYGKPYIDINLVTQGELLKVTPVITYGRPPIARIENGQLIALGDEVPQRQYDEEIKLKDSLWQQLGVEAGKSILMDRNQAIQFVSKTKVKFKEQIRGSGVSDFTVYGTLTPRITPMEDRPGVEFDVELPSETGGQRRTAGLGDVVAAWQRSDRLVPLMGGGYASLPLGWLQQHGSQLLELLAAEQDDQKLPPAAKPALADFYLETGCPLPHTLADLKSKMEQAAKVATDAIPADLTASLRSYQKVGVTWLMNLRGLGMGALLADDMGLGKTVQTLAALQGKALIVAPTSVLTNWQNEIRKFRPVLDVNLYYGPARKLDEKAAVTLTSYALLRMDSEILAASRWNTIVLDEGQNIKNPMSQVSGAAFRLQGDFKIVLTGTPIENSLDDLWSQFNFLNPGLLGSYRFFNEHYAAASAESGGGGRAALKSKIGPFMLRRLKSEVAPELPLKTELKLFAQLSADERTIYNGIYAITKKEVVARLSGGKTHPLEILEAILRLRQACCHPALLPAHDAETSAKMDLMHETVEQALAEQHKILIFSQWTSFLDLIEARLAAAGFSFCRLDGSTRNRGEVVASFQAEDGPKILIMSLKAGGVGLNLTAADHVLIMDPWWNPAVEEQAIDRAHRIGQLRPVIVHRIVAADTIEERILMLQEEKRRLASDLIEDDGSCATLNKEDIFRLFEEES